MDQHVWAPDQKHHSQDFRHVAGRHLVGKSSCVFTVFLIHQTIKCCCYSIKYRNVVNLLIIIPTLKYPECGVKCIVTFHPNVLALFQHCSSYTSLLAYFFFVVLYAFHETWHLCNKNTSKIWFCCNFIITVIKSNNTVKVKYTKVV